MSYMAVIATKDSVNNVRTGHGDCNFVKELSKLCQTRVINSIESQHIGYKKREQTNYTGQ